jgi:serine protease
MLTRSDMKSTGMGFLVILALSSCNPNNPNNPVPKTISGTVQIAGTGTQSAGVRAPEFVPGEVFVTFKTDLSARSLSSLSIAGISLRAVRASSLERTSLYRSNAARSQAETLALVESLKARSDVAWAEPNQILRATAIPNDPNYNLQWHYDAIKLPQAWDLETGANPGSNPVTVAVVDTGLLTGHPDIQGKFLPGFDFISSSQQSNDGNGRDNNPNDPGDTVGGQSSYHGSHVAGTIAALTDNNLGVSGVSWGAKILPVRVLGVGGGSTSDIIDGILWAAGVPVAGVPANPNPAQVINLSLGGEGLCEVESVLQRTVDQVNSKGAIVVVAAGNENVEAADTIPASCSGVITVGATNRQGARAPYSNFGPRIDVMAPGGQGTASSSTDEVLSLDKNDSNGQFVFGYKQGTSMATPHVAGVIALLKSKDPSLNLSRALSILKRTARPLTVGQCTGAGTAKEPIDCGAGLIDAQAALIELGANPDLSLTQKPDFSLTLKPSSIIGERGKTVQIQVSQSNVNGFVGTASLTLSGTTAKLTGSVSGSTVSLNLANDIQFGTYALKVTGTAGGLTREASISVNVVDFSAPPSQQEDVNGTFLLFCYYVNKACDEVKSDGQFINQAGVSSPYVSPELPDGDYVVIAWKDVDNSKKINKGDLLGGYFVGADLGVVRPPVNAINFDLEVVQSVTQANDSRSGRAQDVLNTWRHSK